MISVIIPTYNNVKQLINTIENVCDQNYKDIEIIIIDDNSTDETKNKILNLHNDKIKYYKNPENLGVSQSRIIGVKKTSGKYIAFIDDDDIWINDKLSKQYRLMEEKNLDFVTSNYIINNMRDHMTCEKSLENYGNNFQEFIVRSPGPFFQCCLFSSIFLKKHINKLDSGAEPSEDWDFFILISKANPLIENINENLFQWNLSSQSQSSNTYKESCAIEYIINKHKEYIIINSSKSVMACHYRRVGSLFFYANQYGRAKQYYNKAFRCNVLSFKNIIFKIIYSLPEKISSKIIYKYTSPIQ